MKKNIILFFIVIFILGTASSVFAQTEEKPMEINFFYSLTCPHCAEEEVFLNELQEKYDWIEVKRYEIGANTKNRERLVGFYEQYEVPKEEWGLVPILFTPERYFLGFNKETGEKIENCLKNCLGNGGMETPKRIDVPLFGKISLSGFSPLSLSIIMGALDGFNACAMTALGFLLAVLISTGIRKKVFWIGGTFILVSGLVYFIFISASLNLFLVLEQLKLVTFVVGAVIILFAIYLLRDYWHGVVCKLCQTDSEKQSVFVRWEQKMFTKMRRISESEQSLPIMLVGVAIIAAGVNLVELVCSFGFPLAFTKMLTSLEIPTAHYYFYLLVYIIFYMIDDFIIFTIAVVTLEVSQVSQKYLRIIKLISALVLLVLGILMIIKPEVLSFT